jgi:hypothetical protein
MSDHPAPIKLLTDQRGPLRRAWDALDVWVKALLTLVAAGTLLVTTVRSCDSIVTAGELEAHATTEAGLQATRDGKQESALDGLEEDVDLLFQTQVKLTTDVEWLKQEVSGIRQDLRRMDRGLPLPPLPSPTPTPLDEHRPR